MKKKLKRRIKKMLLKINSKLKKDNIYSYKERVILSIRQICEMIKIDVPTKFLTYSEDLITNTPLIDRLENKNELLNNLVLTTNYNDEYYKKLKKNLLKFKEKYRTQECFEQSDEQLIEMLVHWYYQTEEYGFNYNDYFDYEMYNKESKDYSKFLNSKYRGIVYSVCNDRDFTINFKRKSSFNKRFERFVQRDWIDSSNCDLESFEAFVKKHPKFFAKPVDGTGGANAGIKHFDNNLNALFAECQKERMICEEIVQQHEQMALFNESTLNTCRIYTLYPLHGKPIITLAMVRFGRKGNEVDNFHMGGVSAGVDVKTGKINTNAINRAHLKFENHPDSNVKFIGFQIPCWKKLTNAVIEAAEMFPEIRHIGWDVAITKNNEIEFIEGNSWPNFDITQAVDQIGKKDRYKKYIDELSAAKNNK